MPTYEYECSRCGLHFEKQQSIKDEPLKECPACRGEVRRIVNGGSGFILKSSEQSPRNPHQSCLLEETGQTCCGASQRCGQAHCSD